LSCSKKLSIANKFKKNIIFIINSSTGRSVEEIAKWGTGDSQNEYEVLFDKNSYFQILEITQNSNNSYQILMTDKI